jgi:hypothetical protein
MEHVCPASSSVYFTLALSDWAPATHKPGGFAHLVIFHQECRHVSGDNGIGIPRAAPLYGAGISHVVTD